MGACQSQKKPIQSKGEHQIIEQEPMPVEKPSAPPAQEDPRYVTLTGSAMRDHSFQQEDLSEAIIPHIPPDPKETIQLAMKIALGLNQFEDQILALDRTKPADILHSFQQMLFPYLGDLQNEDLSILKNKSIPEQVLTTCVRTYHILNDLKDKLKPERNYDDPKYVDPEQTLLSEMNAKYVSLQNIIKLEFVQTYSKVAIQQAANPMNMMRFNTKHAIKLAKQQTVKQEEYQKSQSQRSEGPYMDDYSEENIGKVLRQYDSSSYKPGYY